MDELDRAVIDEAREVLAAESDRARLEAAVRAALLPDITATFERMLKELADLHGRVEQLEHDTHFHPDMETE